MKTVVEFEIPAELRLLNVAALKTRPIGSETVNGIATTKYAIDKSIPEGHAEGTLWLSAEGIPMRLAGKFTNAKGKVSTVRWELSGVKTGPQPAALFEPPAGMSKLPPEAIAPLLGLKLKGGGIANRARTPMQDGRQRFPKKARRRGSPGELASLPSCA